MIRTMSQLEAEISGLSLKCRATSAFNVSRVVSTSSVEPLSSRRFHVSTQCRATFAVRSSTMSRLSMNYQLETNQ